MVSSQLGCYVPADECRLTPVDRIFTRLGADDDICRGLSTFLVEMKDVQLMLREAVCLCPCAPAFGSLNRLTFRG